MSANVNTLAKNEAKLAKEIRAHLAELGGRATSHDDIVYHDAKTLVLPRQMSLADAEKFIGRKREEMEEETQFVRSFDFRPWDGAYCTYQALRRAFGAVLHKGSQGMFKRPPQMISIDIDYEQSVQIPWGKLEVPMLPGAVISLGMAHSAEYGPIFTISVLAPKKYAFEIEGIFRLVQTELETNSIYKGKAIDGQDMPKFLNLNAVDPAKVVYTEVVRKQLEANIYSLLRYSPQMRANEIPLKRSVLLYGPYGTGKTLSGFLIAQEAVANSWGFIYVRPNKDNVFQALQTARMYAPCVVFFEDVDTIANPENMQADDVSRLLDEFDGIIAKGSEVIVAMTTNHPEKLHRGMLRPGRLDAVIKIAYLDDDNVQKLCQQVLPSDVVSDDVDWDKVTAAMKGFTPAFVKEAADRAFRSAISENEGLLAGIKLETIDFCLGADSLQNQKELMELAPELEPPDPFTRSLRLEVAKTLSKFGELHWGETYSADQIAAD